MRISKIRGAWSRNNREGWRSIARIKLRRMLPSKIIATNDIREHGESGVMKAMLFLHQKKEEISGIGRPGEALEAMKRRRKKRAELMSGSERCKRITQDLGIAPWREASPESDIIVGIIDSNFIGDTCSLSSLESDETRL